MNIPQSLPIIQQRHGQQPEKVKSNLFQTTRNVQNWWKQHTDPTVSSYSVYTANFEHISFTMRQLNI